MSTTLGRSSLLVCLASAACAAFLWVPATLGADAAAWPQSTPESAPKPVPAGPAAWAGSRPNIVYIMADDHAAHAIGAYGAKFGVDATPRLDRMAADGMRFDNALVGNALCGPSRAILITGKFSHANGFPANDGRKFDGRQPTLAKYLHHVGYQTAIFGKWHLESDPVGYDDWKVCNGGWYNQTYLTPHGKEASVGMSTDVITNFGLDWLAKRDPKKPFLLMLHTTAPHRNWYPAPTEIPLWPGVKFPEPATLFDTYAGRGPGAAQQRMQVGRDLIRAYDLHVGSSLTKPSAPQGPIANNPAWAALWKAAYGAQDEAYIQDPPKGDAKTHWNYQRFMNLYLKCAKGVDRNVGRVLDYLHENGLDENTIVVYSSDNGFYLGDHGWFDKRWAYEESIRVPLIVRWPGHVPAGGVQRTMVQNVDFMPTFLELAGVPLPADIHGVSMLKTLESTQTIALHADQAAYYHYYEGGGEHNVPQQVAVRTPRYTLAWYYSHKPQAYWELFDREQDPQEMKSVYGDPAYAKIQAELTAQLKALAQKYGDGTPPWGMEKPKATGEMDE